MTTSLFGRSFAILLHRLLEIPTIHLVHKLPMLTFSTLKVVIVLDCQQQQFSTQLLKMR